MRIDTHEGRKLSNLRRAKAGAPDRVLSLELAPSTTQQPRRAVSHWKHTGKMRKVESSCRDFLARARCGQRQSRGLNSRRQDRASSTMVRAPFTSLGMPRCRRARPAEARKGAVKRRQPRVRNGAVNCSFRRTIGPYPSPNTRQQTRAVNWRRRRIRRRNPGGQAEPWGFRSLAEAKAIRTENGPELAEVAGDWGLGRGSGGRCSQRKRGGNLGWEKVGSPLSTLLELSPHPDRQPIRSKQLLRVSCVH